MEKSSRILITGGNGLVGYALKKVLNEQGYTNVFTPKSSEYNLVEKDQTNKMFDEIKPDYVFHNAARVYGIMGNMENKGLSYYDNVMINTNTIEACKVYGVKKVVAMGSGCVYPYPSPGLPLEEDMMWMGYPHHSEDSYAISKRAMAAQLNAYKESYEMKSAFVISGNLYGPHDKFDEAHGHVTPSLISKFYRAHTNGDDIIVWGDGSAQRDFLFSYDVAQALINIMLHIEGAVNMGSGNVIKIRDIVDTLADITKLRDKIKWDATKPNGQDYRAYDLSKLKSTGFEANYDLVKGLKITWDWFCENQDKIRK
ncbi:GDP-L-fucose synthase [Aliarcobacter butzleri]|uniref:GDP-L-fucose synthase family protein n=1 Tax=Aliarcobacter butzleri TaxID=28197 RepID=UPI0024DF02A4|nr:GDP-L-fucose synthase [Aliarcobacter butzleri]MDK2084128.1 GDP-L-fucose synthase [Aliarcobacter butzleri]